MGLPKGRTNNPKGKPKGAKGVKTKQWEALGESIISQQAEQFNTFMMDLWESDASIKKMAAAELYLKTLEYFKPKLSRSDVNQKNLHDFAKPIVIEKTYQKDDD